MKKVFPYALNTRFTRLTTLFQKIQLLLMFLKRLLLTILTNCQQPFYVYNVSVSNLLLKVRLTYLTMLLSWPHTSGFDDNNFMNPA